MGTGIIKIIEAYENHERKAQFEIFDNSIKVILPTQNAKTSLTSDEQGIIDYLSGGRLDSSSEITKANGFSKGKTVQLLNSLVEKNVIKIEGSGRGTKYKI